MQQTINAANHRLGAKLTATDTLGHAAAIAAAIAEVGATSIRDMGRVMGELKGKYTGQMDFGAVGAALKGKSAG